MGTTPEKLGGLSGVVSASEVGEHLKVGRARLTAILGTTVPELQALVVPEKEWSHAPREAESPYPFGLPYFTRSTTPPALVLPEKLSGVLQPRTRLTLPLAVWHELAHAFFLQGEVVRIPLWLGEFTAQAAAAAVAFREGLSLEGHLSTVERPGFTVRGFELPASASAQMSFQNLLLSFGAAAIERFGDEFVGRLVGSLWEESEVVDEARAEGLLVSSLGKGGREWLAGREEF